MGARFRFADLGLVRLPYPTDRRPDVVRKTQKSPLVKTSGLLFCCHRHQKEQRYRRQLDITSGDSLCRRDDRLFLRISKTRLVVCFVFRIVLALVLLLFAFTTLLFLFLVAFFHGW